MGRNDKMREFKLLLFISDMLAYAFLFIGLVLAFSHVMISLVFIISFLIFILMISPYLWRIENYGL